MSPWCARLRRAAPMPILLADHWTQMQADVRHYFWPSASVGRRWRGRAGPMSKGRWSSGQERRGPPHPRICRARWP
ncbi:hypothetical protein OH76DRAFT_883141 [Lentinus brumalis]|uniref:Uncharacterized protein n=1 Tax=Lentinus brumalis TaxID=2498619 RepID=A0A371DRU4_9APHY|nr:hypothetical protein OH76DRAFT_883141 [Polyporus brumalis]